MLCVIAKLSDGATEQLRVLRETAAVRGRALAPLHGHITLASWLPEEDADFIGACADIARAARPFSVVYTDLRVLHETSVIVAVPSPSPDLVRLHEAIAGRFACCLDRWTRGSEWLPHTTLLYAPGEDPEEICGSMRREFRPFEAKIDRIEFSRVLDTGYSVIGSVGLSGT